MPHRSLPFACLALLVMTVAPARATEPSPAPTSEALREAVTRGLRVVEKAARSYPQHRECFSCHHQTLPMFAMVKAGEHGVSPARGLLGDQAEFTVASFRDKVAAMSQGKGIGGAAMTVGYSLWTLALAGRERDEVADAMVAFLLKTQKPPGHWSTSTRRPPMEESVVACTVLAAE